VATFYRCPNPTDWLCPCGRVARELRRRGVAYDEVRVPYRRSRRPEVVALSGQPRVPVVVLEGEPVCDSHRIVEHLRWRAGKPR
jgi:glutathione S-transferase